VGINLANVELTPTGFPVSLLGMLDMDRYASQEKHSNPQCSSSKVSSRDLTNARGKGLLNSVKQQMGVPQLLGISNVEAVGLVVYAKLQGR